MKQELEWVSVNKSMPEIKDGNYAISVLCSVHDPTYEECSPGNGSEVQELTWDGKEFKTIAYGNGDWEWYPVMDMVTHWMYKPKAFQVTDKEFTFDAKGINR